VAVRVSDLGILEEAMPIRLRTRLPAGRRIEVSHLLVSGGEVWARFNRSLVVWRAPAGRIPSHQLSLWRMGLHVAATLFALVVWRCGSPDPSPNPKSPLFIYFSFLISVFWSVELLHFPFFVLLPWVDALGSPISDVACVCLAQHWCRKRARIIGPVMPMVTVSCACPQS
jgi:hypothetical protein